MGGEEPFYGADQNEPERKRCVHCPWKAGLLRESSVSLYVPVGVPGGSVNRGRQRSREPPGRTAAGVTVAGQKGAAARLARVPSHILAPRRAGGRGGRAASGSGRS